jgi:hypothetical protein
VSHEIDPAWVKHQNLDHKLEALSIASFQDHAQSTLPLYTLGQCERYQRVVEEGTNLFRTRIYFCWVSLYYQHLICQLHVEIAQELGRPAVDMHNICVERKLHIQIVQD